MAFWFFSAPLVRYGLSWLVLPLMLAIAQCFPAGWRGRVPALPEGGRMGAWMAALLVIAAIGGAARQPWHRLADTAFPRYPEVPVRSRGVHAGIPITEPMQGNQCWNAPRLCTPGLKDGLVFAPFLWSWWVLDPS